MPRNSNGTYTLPESPFAAGTVIESSVVNSDFSDIGNTLTTALAATGVSFMTAPIEGFIGSVTNPGYRFDEFLGAGFYTSTGQLAIAISSISVGNISTSGTATWQYKHFFNETVAFFGGMSVSGGIQASLTITGDLIVTGGLVVGVDATAINDSIILTDTDCFLDYNSGTNIVFNFADNDFLFYDRTNNKFTFEINNSIVHTVADGAVFFAGYLVNTVVATPASAPANQAGIYAKDNSGTPRMVYINEQGVETFMGGPGQWELIAQTVLSTSVASITYNLTKVYSRLALVAMRLVCGAGTGFIFANVSDDAGLTLVSCRSTIVSEGTDVFTTASLALMRVINTPTVDLKAEFNRMDKTGPKQWNSYAATPNDDNVYMNTGQIASCGVVNAIVISNSVPANLVSGTINLYGLMTI